MITVSDVSVGFSGQDLFSHVNLLFTPGNCYGVIGANGAGKSTFLKVLSGELEPTKGDVSIDPKCRMSVLKQDHFAYEEFTVLDTIMQGNQRLYDVMKQKDELYAKPDFSEEDGHLAAELEAEFAEMNGWDAETDAGKLLQGLGLETDMLYMQMSALTESEKVKVLLARALFGQPDIILLDEPTNGLDIKSINWLEDFLMDYMGTVIVVSHDRHFLNKVCTHMADLDFGKIKLYVGNYDFWKQSSELAARLQADRNAKAEEKIKELQEFVARFSANASKSKQATSRKKMLDKIELEEIVPSSRKYPFINFKAEREIGNDLLTVENLTVKMDGETILDNISFILRPGDKTAIIGQNDIQTTALIRALADDIDYEGTIKWGVTTSRSYLPKDNSKDFASGESILEWLRQFAEKGEDDDTFLRGFLGRMLFSGDEVNKSVSVLSGGEKVRVMLSKLMLLKSNVLLLDDPTNHLDLESISSLNDGVRDFKESVIFASHDHEFIQTIANHIVVVSKNGVIDRIDETYDEFLENEEVQAKVKALWAD